MISFINPFNLENFLEKEGQPVLLACFEKDLDFITHLNILENTSHLHKGKLRVCLLNNEYMSLMNRKYEIYGTPSFVVFHLGKKKSMMVGKINIDEMKDFIKNSMMKQANALL